MFLAVDIGNTNIVISIFRIDSPSKELSISRELRIPTSATKVCIEKKIRSRARSFKARPDALKAAIICSVVPAKTDLVGSVIKRELKIKPIVLGKDIIVPIKNLYKEPKKVGQDRLVNAYSCSRYYGKPAIIVDFGTATTFDFLNARGEYAGGLITPGVEITLDALAQRTALLPRIELKRPRALIGTDTVDSIRSGVFNGLASLTDGIIDKIRRKYSKKAIVVATGGLSPFFAPYCKNIDYVDKDLTLKGLFLIYQTLRQ